MKAVETIPPVSINVEVITPQFTFPPNPAPPDTTNAPVVVLVDSVLSEISTVPVTIRSF